MKPLCLIPSDIRRKRAVDQGNPVPEAFQFRRHGMHAGFGKDDQGIPRAHGFRELESFLLNDQRRHPFMPDNGQFISAFRDNPGQQLLGIR